MAGDEMIMNPRNQHELVIFTLIFCPEELSMGWFMANYKTHKLSNRLYELERLFNKTLTSKTRKKFVNRFGHESSYVVYTPIVPKSELILLYNQLQSKKN